MRQIARLLLLFFLLGLIVNAHSQSQSIQFNRVARPAEAPWFLITGITQDPLGYMWFSSGQKLYRYDGYRFTVYRNDPLNAQSLANKNIETIFADSKGFIWIGYQGAGLDRFDHITQTYTRYQKQPNQKDGLVSDLINVIIEDRDQTLWIGTRDGLANLDTKTGKFSQFVHDPQDNSSLSHNDVRVLYLDSKSSLWVGTGSPFYTDHGERRLSGGLNLFNKSSKTFTRYQYDPQNPNSLSDNRVRAISEDSKGTLWIGTAGDGLHTMDRNTGIITRHPYDPFRPEKLSRPAQKMVEEFNYVDDHITFIKEDGKGAIWIGTMENGISRFDPVTKKMSHFESDSITGFTSKNAWIADTSRDGVLWVSTWEEGLFRIDPFQVRIPRFETNDVVSEIFEDNLGILWLGTSRGLVRKDPVNDSILRFEHNPSNPFSLSNNRVDAICDAGQDMLWIGGPHGLNLFNKKTQTFKRFVHDSADPLSLSNNNVFSLYRDAKGKIWIGTSDGLDVLDPTTMVFKHFKDEVVDSFSVFRNLVTSVLEKGDGKYWVSNLNGNGINLLDTSTGQYKKYLEEEFITHIFQDSQSELWIGTLTNIFRLDEKKDLFVRYDNPSTGLPFIHTTHITEDDQANLWIGSASGIVKLNSSRTESSFYGPVHGIEAGTLSYVSGFKGKNNRIYFGSSRGYFVINPDTLSSNIRPPEILLTEFRLGNQVVIPGDDSFLRQHISNTKDIRLSFSQNNFSFGFAGIDFSNSEKNAHLYMLENYDNEWRLSGADRRAYYFNVPPGKYIFHVKAANSKGIWGTKSLGIIITPPWYRTTLAYFLFAISFLGGIWGFVHYRSRSLKKEKRILEEKVSLRTKEVLQQKEEIAKALHELKSTQDQLIQREKMASLGELTAGVAHEIQNPLNFVNNFSEVNKELLTELNDEVEKGNLSQVKTIAKDIIDNEEKINYHGKRADSIVKGMLQHSRSSSGQKESTDINALADEYLRLSYHGMRAKNKTFNAILQTDFDNDVGRIVVIPQNIGRVLLNVYNNAFYSMSEKAKLNRKGYDPKISVTTKKLDGNIIITVRDNGTGIPEKIKDKIFQPFFTTKPPGQGTGLGLSLSYDIITKEHGGEIEVESPPAGRAGKEGEGAEFIVSLPL
jgi:ligand-binding sensor domain-containing protein/signal transduction histidine kinase